MAQKETAFQDTRYEWVTETTIGTTPTDPSWNTLADEVSEFVWTPSTNKDPFTPTGQGDPSDIYDGHEDHTLRFQFLMDQFPIDSSDNIVTPAAEPIEYDFGSSDYPSHSLMVRRETTYGGNDSSGLREFTVARGARPIRAQFPADPGESTPVEVAVEYRAEWARSFVIHQPSASTTVDVENTTSSNIDVIVENEGAGTTETITATAGGTTSGATSFSDIDAIWAKSEPTDGKINVTDGSGTTLLENGLGQGGLTGSGVQPGPDDGERGVMPLGTGSHGSAVSGTPGDHTGRSVTSTLGGVDAGDLPGDKELIVEMDVTPRPIEDTGKPDFDIGPRTAEVDITTAGAVDSHSKLKRYLVGLQEDYVLTFANFSDATITLNSAEVVDTADRTIAAGTPGQDNSLALRGTGDPSVQMNQP